MTHFHQQLLLSIYIQYQLNQIQIQVIHAYTDMRRTESPHLQKYMKSFHARNIDDARQQMFLLFFLIHVLSNFKNTFFNEKFVNFYSKIKQKLN